MDYCNNHFIRTAEFASITITETTITGSFKQGYVADQYIAIKGTILNDGIYKITEVAGDTLTLDATLTAETSDTLIYGLAVPKTFLDIVTSISGSTSTEGIASESLGDYSVNYVNGSGWQQTYKSQLMQYKKPYSDLLRWYYDTGRRQVSNTRC